MKERPIIFSAPMVRAILEGRKTQTRRVVKWRDVPNGLDLGFSGLSAREYPKGWVLESGSRLSSEWRCAPTRCPYGAPGDRLWVREAWAAGKCADGFKPSMLHPGTWLVDNGGLWFPADNARPRNPISPRGKTRPGMFMPRWASRILLEITSVRVERIQDISEADAQAEGIVSRRIGTGDARTGCRDAFGLACDDSVWASSTIQAYGALWESINGPDSWSANPWVWVVEFKIVMLEPKP